MQERYVVTAIDDAAKQLTIEECPPLFTFTVRGQEPEPFKPKSYTLNGADIGGQRVAVGTETLVSIVRKRRGKVPTLITFKCKVAKTTLQQEQDRIKRSRDREKKRRAALPSMKYFKPRRNGFTYRTATRPFTAEEQEQERQRYGFVRQNEIGVFISIEVSHMDGRALVDVEQSRDSGDGSYITSTDSGRSLTVCRMDRINHKALTAFALALDESLPTIAALYDSSNRDGAIQLAKQKLAHVPGVDFQG